MISELNGWPACALVNASPAVLPWLAHDSGPGRVASPFPYGSFIRYSLPVLTGAFDVPFSWPYFSWPYFKDDVRRAAAWRPKGLHYVDVGTSGGVWGLDRGYCLMIGGPKEAVDRLAPIFKTLAPGRGDIPRTPGREELGGPAEEGYLHCGPAGAGHFVKMVHNGIEYGVMQSYAEGFDILRGVGANELPEERRYQLNLADIAEVWRRGSVIGSWLLDLAAMALAENPTLSDFKGVVQDSGEGRWTVDAALEEAVPAEVLTSALYSRFRSREEHAFAEKVLSAMRSKFGGHVESVNGG